MKHMQTQEQITPEWIDETLGDHGPQAFTLQPWEALLLTMAKSMVVAYEFYEQGVASREEGLSIPDVALDAAEDQVLFHAQAMALVAKEQIDPAYWLRCFRTVCGAHDQEVAARTGDQA